MGDLRRETFGEALAEAGRVAIGKAVVAVVGRTGGAKGPAGTKCGCIRTGSDEIGRKSVDRRDAGVRMCGF